MCANSQRPTPNSQGDRPLRLSQRALGVATREVARLVHERRIRFVMIDGIAHTPTDAFEDLEAGR